MTENPQYLVLRMEDLLKHHNVREQYFQGGVPMVRCGCNLRMSEDVHPNHQAVLINDYVLAEERMKQYAYA